MRIIHRAMVLLLLFAVLVSGNISVRGADVPALAPVPDAGSQIAANKVVQEVFKDEIAHATRPETKLALAQKLTEAARETKNDPASKYVLLTMALDNVVAGVDVDGAMALVDDLAANFQIDMYAVRLDALTKLLAEARKASETAKVGKVSVLIAEMKDAKEAYDQVKGALAVIEKNPTDAAANLAAGKFYCFTTGDWNKGLPMLVLSGDPILKDLAKKELASPAEGDKAMEVADGWFDVASKLTGSAQKGTQKHAREWYEKALPGLTGISKLKVEKRLQSLQGEEPSKGWVVIFRSSDPAIWNTTVNKGKDFAMPLANAPAGVLFLKMSNPSGAYVIIPMTNGNLGKQVNIGKGVFGWTGVPEKGIGGYHLGIFDKTVKKSQKDLKGTVGIYAAPMWVNYSGWGFGNDVGVDEKQAYAWDNKTVGVTIFEISVKTIPLTETEKKFLRE